MITLLTCTSIIWQFYTQKANVTDKLVYLGNPLASDRKTGRALNVWDLQVFNGKVYIAGGDTTTNAGPINVWAYNPTGETWEREYTVQEEAIEQFKVFDNELYIPAADPRKGDQTKFYRKSANGQWQRYADHQLKLAHVRDLIKIDDQRILLVGNHRQPHNLKIPSIAITKDNGRSFQGAGIGKKFPKNIIFYGDYNWFFSIFKYQNKIYAASSMLRDYKNFAGTIAVYYPDKEKFFLNFKLRNNELIPAQTIGGQNSKHGRNIIYRLWHPLEFQNRLVYTVRSYSNSLDNYHQAYMNSLGLYLKEDMGKTPEKIQLPHRAMGEDLLIIKDELYVLANRRLKPNKFIVYVYKIKNLQQPKSWQQVLHFHSKNKARSFEYLDRTFYFGLGQDYGDPIGNSGDIISYKQDQN